MYDCVIWYSAIVLGFIIPLQIICATQMSEPKIKESGLIYSDDFPFTDCDDWKLFDYTWKISGVLNLILLISTMFILFNEPKINMYIDKQGNIYEFIPEGYIIEEEVQFEIID